MPSAREIPDFLDVAEIRPVKPGRSPEAAAQARLAAAVFKQAVEDLANPHVVGDARRSARYFLDPDIDNPVRELLAASLGVDGREFARRARDAALSGAWVESWRKYQLGGPHGRRRGAHA